MVTPWGLPIVPIVWESIVLDESPTPARTGLLLSMVVYPHYSTDNALFLFIKSAMYIVHTCIKHLNYIVGRRYKHK